jgi:hypothetical protein
MAVMLARVQRRASKRRVVARGAMRAAKTKDAPAHRADVVAQVVSGERSGFEQTRRWKEKSAPVVFRQRWGAGV